MFKSLPNSKYPTGMLYFLTEHTLIIYVQYIKGTKRKTSYLLEKSFEKNLVHFVSDSIFKRLQFDYPSSETVSNKKIKIKNCFLDDCVFLEIRLTQGNQLLPNMSNSIFKFVQINMKHLLYRPALKAQVSQHILGSLTRTFPAHMHNVWKWMRAITKIRPLAPLGSCMCMFEMWFLPFMLVSISTNLILMHLQM